MTLYRGLTGMIRGILTTGKGQRTTGKLNRGFTGMIRGILTTNNGQRTTDKLYRGFTGMIRSILVGCAFALAALSDCRGDSVIMKNGIVYRGQGAPDRDNTLIFISDGLKRVVVRDSKIERIEANNAFRTGEKFQLVQPMTVHGGLMPEEVVSVQAGPWNERGRRSFEYVGARLNKPIRMEQAIIEIGPHIVKFRGVDGFWVGQVETDQVPRESVTRLLARVQQKNVEERERVVRFLMDVGWLAEARQELDRLVNDFPKPDLKERAASARQYILQAQAVERRGEIDVARRAQQYQRVANLVKTFNEKGIPTELLVEVREIQRRDMQQRAADQGMAAELRKLADKLPSAAQGPWKEPLVEVLKAIDLASDAVRDRLAAWRKAKSQPGLTPEAQFALAMSGYVAGHELASPDLKAALTLWKARELVRDYVAGTEPAARSQQAAQLDALDWPALAGSADMVRRLEALTRIVQLMPPPRHDDEVTPLKTMLNRVPDEENNEPTEYAVRLPPEYHPLRSYPAIVVLHSGDGPTKAIDQWAGEAARRGYILIAPEYSVPGQPAEYRYTASEHAAVELALRDARKRYAIDSDRVFAAGQLSGGNMAWDYALAHPDVFAGVVVISGLPAKYVPRYLAHHERLPMFFVIGDLAPAASKFIYDKYVKPLILKTWDITYVEYYRRGLEELPEEITPAFDWMDRHRRDPYPKSFKAFTARTSDDRFYGMVVREFSPGRVTAPEAAEVLGQNLNPASIEMKSSSISNLIRLEVIGIKRLDVWLSPKLIDFKRRLEVRIKDRPYFKGQAKLEMEPMLEDLRIRGDRQQLYWFRISAS
jgi:pimeloyl-ACP methyl ester carboxylesterase